MVNKIPPDVLDDVCTRFLLNLPDSEKQDGIRLCFQMEQCHWFYLDFYCTPGEKHNQGNCCPQVGIRDFIRQVFAHCPFLRKSSFKIDSLLDEWRQYKSSIPTYGAILLDDDFNNVLMVQGFYAKSSWGFPKGKVNEGELPHKCAIREVFEEVGFDMSDLIDPEDFLEKLHNEGVQRLYVVQGVDINYEFLTHTRNEIKQIKWFKLDDLPVERNDYSKVALGIYPNHFYNVVPFIESLHQLRYERVQNASYMRKRTRARKSTSKSAKKSASPDPVNGVSITPSYLLEQATVHQNEKGRLRKGRQLNMNQEGAQKMEIKSIAGCIRPSRAWKNFRINWDPIYAEIESVV